MENMIAVTCSGTIGKVQIIPRYMDGWAANQHSLRVIATEGENAGYIYTWLASDYGQALITRHSYGSVILEIDRWMLGQVPIPMAAEEVRKEIGGLVLHANNLRDEAWRLERHAIHEMEEAIKPVTTEVP